MTKTNLYHSCPEFLLRGHDYNVTVAVAGAVTDAVLVYHAKDEEKTSLLIRSIAIAASVSAIMYMGQLFLTLNWMIYVA